jgi:very-short-patch-repair endonuclease
VPAEALFWKALRNLALSGFKFRRQHPMGHYVVDFASVKCKLAIELNGLSHLPETRKTEIALPSWNTAGWCVIRFWNTEVYDHFEPVREAIYLQCPLTPNPSPPPFCWSQAIALSERGRGEPARLARKRAFAG